MLKRVHTRRRGRRTKDMEVEREGGGFYLALTSSSKEKAWFSA